MKQRQVSIELLRIVAMLMVITLHANFMGIGTPTEDTILKSDGILRTLLQSLCICAVDTFVMISGWFGIRPSVRGFVNFMWQVFYFVGLLYLASYIIDGTPITPKNILSCFGLYGGGGWFVASYIGLYILAPVLNEYVANASRKKIELTLIAFFAFEFIWGNTLSVGFVVGGYSTFSFIGIYILAGLLRKIQLNVSSRKLLCVFLSATILNAFLYMAATYTNQVAIRDMLFNYINPLVIISAVSLLLFFRQLPTPPQYIRIVYQTLIPTLATSCFAAYLLHAGTNFAIARYLAGVSYIYAQTSDILSIVAIFSYILGVFILAVIVDQPRQLIWRKLFMPIFHKNNG